MRGIILVSALASMIAMTSGMPAIAAEPIAMPEYEPPFKPEGKPLDGLIITLDPGHGGSAHQGGYAGSARGVESGVVEGDLNMLAGALLRWHLMNAGAQVHMTRWDDRKVTLDTNGEPSGRAEELGARTAVAEKTASHLFLALHHNATTRDTANGVVILIDAKDKAGNPQPLERQFADILREEVQKMVHSAETFPHYEIEHPLVSSSDIPSAVVEFGFLTNRGFDEWVAKQGSHKTEARAVYNAVARMWSENRSELEEKRRELFPDAVSAEESRKAIENLKPPINNMASQYWPLDRAPNTPQEAQNIVDLYKKTILSDRTTYWLDTKLTKSGDGWTMDGSTSNERVGTAVAQLLEAAGVKPLENKLRVLPDRDKLGEKHYGEMQIPMALTWNKPAENSIAQTQLLLGDRVFLLDTSEDGNYYLVHAGEGYLGWVRREAIRRMNAEEFRTRGVSPRVRIARDYMADDFRIPAGAHLPLVSNGDGASTMTIGIPVGVRGTGHNEWVDIPADHVHQTAADEKGRQIAEAALEFMTTPYVFSGRSRTGIDCSGLTTVSYATTGLTLPRDAWQQAIVGQLVATTWYREDLRPGDLLFFMDSSGRITHVGISIGGTRFVHSSPPEVQISSLSAGDKFYSEHWDQAFVFARRPLD